MLVQGTLKHRNRPKTCLLLLLRLLIAGFNIRTRTLHCYPPSISRSLRSYG
ncbi:hypothetical protein IFM46972_07824 [Aspergillus udagawae]|uniref:Uncharacterized protein n=1 Tax=Aspergillus udagawae TaxID=91492 RepID=A0A8H3PBR4_9EURO|nr:hypothetical protein IFM46972_07824 [Aspergillus udagawae]